MTENNYPQNADNQAVAADATVDASTPQPPHGAVTLSLLARRDEDAAVIRQLFPKAEERREAAARKPGPDGTWVDVLLPVFRCTYPTMQLANEACRLLPTAVVVRLEAPTVLEEEEFEALTEYHCRGALVCEYIIRYGASGWSDRRRWRYHNERLTNLASVLGDEYVRATVDRISRTFDPRTETITIPQSDLKDLHFIDEDDEPKQ